MTPWWAIGLNALLVIIYIIIFIRHGRKHRRYKERYWKNQSNGGK